MRLPWKRDRRSADSQSYAALVLTREDGSTVESMLGLTDRLTLAALIVEHLATTTHQTQVAAQNA